VEDGVIGGGGGELRYFDGMNHLLEFSYFDRSYLGYDIRLIVD
jgi:hypothetical protein